MKRVNLLLLAGLLLGVLLTTAYGTRGPFPPWITKITGNVTFDQYGVSSVGADGVGSGDLAANSVLSDNVVDATLTAADLGTDSVAADEIAAGAVGTSEIADGSVAEADAAAYDADGLLFARVARLEYDVATDGGTIGTYDLGQTIPAGSLIIGSVLYYETQFTDGGSGTVAIHCEDANNILTAADITGNAAGTKTIANIDFGSYPTWVASLAAACNPIATVAGANQTAGKLILWLFYVEHN